MLDALPHFVRAAELDPRSANMALNLSQTFALLRDAVGAVRQFERAISLVPDSTGPYADKVHFLNLRLEGNTERARAVLEEAERSGLREHQWVTYVSVLTDVLDGDHEEALDKLASSAADVFEDGLFYVLKSQLHAKIYGLMGHPQRERAYYDSTRSILESEIKERPDDERLHSALGIAYAGLGRKDDAVREGELAIQLLPMSKEAWRGAWRVEDLARIYAMVGEYDAAIDRLESLLAVPSNTSVPMLRIDPVWDPLRDDPRFQQLVAGEN